MPSSVVLTLRKARRVRQPKLWWRNGGPGPCTKGRSTPVILLRFFNAATLGLCRWTRQCSLMASAKVFSWAFWRRF